MLDHLSQQLLYFLFLFSLYHLLNNDHSDYLGFTWERCLTDRIPFGISATDTELDTIGEKRGAKTQALSASNNGPHHHGYYAIGGGNALVSNAMITVGNPSGTNLELYTNDQGSGTAFSILNPVEVVAFWKRTE